MPKATCRCGAILEIPKDGTDRMVCPQCSAKVRIRHVTKGEASDGYIRFDCPCGRRLKVRESNPMQKSGKCPDCGRVVPVPTETPFANLKSYNSIERPTDEMNAVARAAIEQWSAAHLAGNPPKHAAAAAAPSRKPAATVKSEAGLRVCQRCGKPLHLSAVTCRDCGAPVPRR